MTKNQMQNNAERQVTQQDILQGIAQASDMEIEPILKAVLARYAVLFPDWDVSTVSLKKDSKERNEQLDGMIRVLQTMKTFPE